MDDKPVMDSRAFAFSVTVLARADHFNSKTWMLKHGVRDWISASINGMQCFPLFTTFRAVERFLSNHPPIEGGSTALECDAAKLITAIEIASPAELVVDPAGPSGPGETLDAKLILTGLRGITQKWDRRTTEHLKEPPTHS